MIGENEELREMAEEQLGLLHDKILQIPLVQRTLYQHEVMHEFNRRADATLVPHRRWLSVRLGARYADIAVVADENASATLRKAVPLTTIGTDHLSVIGAFLRGEEPTQHVHSFDHDSSLVGALHTTITAPMGFDRPHRIEFLELWIDSKGQAFAGNSPCGLFVWETAPAHAIAAFKAAFPIHIELGRTLL